MEMTETFNQGTGIDPDYFPVRDETLQDLQCHGIIRVIEKPVP